MGRSAAPVWRRMRIGGVLGGGTGGSYQHPAAPLQLDRGMQLPIAAVALPLGCLGFGAAPAIGGQGAADIVAFLDGVVRSPKAL
jgi:hypothetical protein